MVDDDDYSFLDLERPRVLIPDAIQLPADSLARIEAQKHIARNPDGTYLAGQSGNPRGRRPGVGALAARWREYLELQPQDSQYKLAANSLGLDQLDLEADCHVAGVTTLGDLLCYTNLMRALEGSIDYFREIGDRIEPKPRRVDVTVAPAGASAAAMASADDVDEQAAAVDYYASLTPPPRLVN